MVEVSTRDVKLMERNGMPGAARDKRNTTYVLENFSMSV